MSTLPVTMTVDDELARLRSMLADLRTLNKDMARICDERDRYRAALVLIAEKDENPMTWSAAERRKRTIACVALGRVKES